MNNIDPFHLLANQIQHAYFCELRETLSLIFLSLA